jgi:hypothetical protein
LLYLFLPEGEKVASSYYDNFMFFCLFSKQWNDSEDCLKISICWYKKSTSSDYLKNVIGIRKKGKVLILLGSELRALCLLVWWSTTWATFPGSFGLLFFWIRFSGFVLWSYLCLICSWINIHYHIQLICWAGVLLTFCPG